MLYLILIFNNDFGFYDNDLFYFLDNLGKFGFVLYLYIGYGSIFFYFYNYYYGN